MGRAQWKRHVQRLISMSPGEISDRLRQHTSARIDLLRYKLGADFCPALRSESPECPRFFFSSEAVPALCSLMRQRLAEQVGAIIQRAERICAHHFDLLGYRGLDYGADIDWHCDRVHEVRASRKPWFKIRYLDFGEAGDSKITWELNRHQHLVTLAKAYRLTGNEKFAAEIFRQWKHWHRENPYPIGVNWASSLEVGFRSLSWLWMYFLLEGTAAVPADFRTAWLKALAVAGRHIEKHLSTYFSPNTHLLGEGVALFFIGTLCPELPPASRWQKRGWEIVQQEAERQVQSDGFHFEQSTYYHVYALDFFLHSMVLASLNGIRVPALFESKVERMLNAVCVFGGNGAPARLGDDDGGRLFDPQRNRTEDLLDPLAAGAILFGRGDFKAIAGGLREETLWLLGETGVAEFDRIVAKRPQQESVGLQASGFYFMASAEPAQQLLIDAGPQGSLAAGHGHADALGVTASAGGKALLIDPGTFEYAGKDSARNRFRGTKAHNTLVVDGADQAEPKGPFSWERLTNTNAEGWVNGQIFDLFKGSHDGYQRLADPVLHRRWVFSLKSRFWLVRDEALGRGSHQLDLYWHLSPELEVRDKDSQRFLTPTGQGLLVHGVEDAAWAGEIREGEWSPVYGRSATHNVLRFSANCKLPAEFATLLQPVGHVNAAAGRLTRVQAPAVETSVAGYRFVSGMEEHYFVFGRGKRWNLGRWESDAEFLYCGLSQDFARQVLICCNATYAAIGGREVVAAPKPVLRCEIIRVGDKLDVICPDQNMMINRESFGKIFEETEGQPIGSIPGGGKS